MSTAAIEKVVNDLKELPEADQELVLGFLQTLKRQHNGEHNRSTGDNPALVKKNGRLVFTGKLDAPHIDWVQIVREERDAEIMRQALGLARE